MKHKKFLIAFILIFALVLLCGMLLVYKNYKLGQDLHDYVNDMYVQCVMLADGITLLEDDFAAYSSGDHSFGSRILFDEALSRTQSSFGDLNMPILEDVRQQYIAQFTELYRQLVNDSDNAKLIALLSDPAQANELTELKEQMLVMAEYFREFTKKYNQMSEWERCFYSWEKERSLLTDNLRLP